MLLCFRGSALRKHVRRGDDLNVLERLPGAKVDAADIPAADNPYSCLTQTGAPMRK
jgi:hypothetical protein